LKTARRPFSFSFGFTWSIQSSLRPSARRPWMKVALQDVPVALNQSTHFTTMALTRSVS